ncbi:DUF6122 family protein [Zunongwangia endophytica]|uniref:DUF6122 family protein n=1 Tax=Zunongwangia endophytica TaxID=1808945 RepID=A0ABV8H7U1_9FLAO|nr:DUF6122 family protein [Zunongwangia endophytica]MDN3595225.1 DUF6122 family protein [Zunongwangia endophytica]
MIQSIFHYSMHFLAIGIIAYFFDKDHWKQNWIILALTMLVDIDHIFASPLFDPNRCGIGFHPLHSQFAIACYVIAAVFLRKGIFKLIFIGLSFHMLTDFLDCLFTFYKCGTCYDNSALKQLIQLQTSN